MLMVELLEIMNVFNLSLQYPKGRRGSKVIFIDNTPDAKKAVKEILDGPPTLSYDIETGKLRDHPQAGLSPYLSSISLFQFCNGETIYIFDAYGIDSTILFDIFETKNIIAHYALFDLMHTLHNTGKNIESMHCTMIMYNLLKCARFANNSAIDGEGDGQVANWMGKQERYGGSLRAVAAHILGIDISKTQQTSDWSQRPLSKEQLCYAATDVLVTYDCAKVLLKALSKYKLSSIYNLNRKAMHPLVRMMLNGLKVDTDAHIKHIEEWEKEKQNKLQQIEVLFDGVNLNSPTQISKWIEANVDKKLKTNWPVSEKTGLFKADTKTLHRYQALPWVDTLLSYKKYSKLLSTYGQSLLDAINPVTNRLHGSFTLGYTGTGRLSSRNPNLQNIPRGTTMRSIFIPSPRNIYVGADYSQIEIRVAGILSGDKAILQAYKDGIDLHKLIVAKVTGKDLKEITKQERQMGKAINFGLLFGMGWRGLIEYSKWNYGVSMTEQDSRKAVSEFRNLYKGYTSWQKKCRQQADISGTTTTMVGKVRKLSVTNQYTCSVNHPVQGSAAEIVIQALCNLYDAGAYIVNCVHDEIILEVLEYNVEEHSSTLEKCMIKAVTDIFPKCPKDMLKGIVELKTGKNWDECH